MEKQIKSQADEILELANGYGVDQNLLFVTTFDKHHVQIKATPRRI